MNVVILRGVLSRPPGARDLPSGGHLVTYEVTVRAPDGAAESVPVTWPGPPRRARQVPAGAEVIVTGRVRRRFFRARGVTASRIEVVADAVVPVHQADRAGRAVVRALARVAGEANL